jgi:hypothetical protein
MKLFSHLVKGGAASGIAPLFKVITHSFILKYSTSLRKGINVSDGLGSL